MKKFLTIALLTLGTAIGARADISVNPLAKTSFPTLRVGSMTFTTPTTTSYMTIFIPPKPINNSFGPQISYPTIFVHGDEDSGVYGGLKILVSSQTPSATFPNDSPAIKLGDAYIFAIPGTDDLAQIGWNLNTTHSPSFQLIDAGMYINTQGTYNIGFMNVLGSSVTIGSFDGGQGTLYLYDSTDDNYPYITTSDDDFGMYNGLGGLAGLSLSRLTLTPNGDSSTLDINGFSGGTSALVNIKSGASTVVTITTTSLDLADGKDIVIGNGSGSRIGQASSKIGLFGAPPVQRQSSTTDLRQALINLGAYSTGGASPLDLNGGIFNTSAQGGFASVVVTGNNTSVIQQVVKGASGQATDIVQWATNANSTFTRVNSRGETSISTLTVGGYTSTTGSATINAALVVATTTVISTNTLLGSVSFNYRGIVTTGTIDGGDHYLDIVTSTTIQLSLPSTTGIQGREYKFFYSSGNAGGVVNIIPNGTDTILNISSYTLRNLNESAVFFNNGKKMWKVRP